MTSSHPDPARPRSSRRTALIVLAVLAGLVLLGALHVVFPPGG